MEGLSERHKIERKRKGKKEGGGGEERIQELEQGIKRCQRGQQFTCL